MSLDKPRHLIINEKNNNASLNNDLIYLYIDVLNIIPFGNGRELLSYTPKKNFR